MPVSAFRSLTLRSGEDAATTAWVAAVVTNGGTVSAGRRTVVNTLIAGLKLDSVWTKLDRLWILAAENEPSALTDMVALELATATGAPTFTADDGYTGQDLNSPTKYISTPYNASVDGINYTQNAAHISVWCFGNTASVAGGGSMGNTDPSPSANLFVTYLDGNVYARINDSAGSSGAPGTRAGHWLINRSGSNATQLYQNGSLFASPNAASSAVANADFAILAAAAGKIGNPNIASAASMGGNLSSTDVSNFYSRLRTYMTAVGVP